MTMKRTLAAKDYPYTSWKKHPEIIQSIDKTPKEYAPLNIEPDMRTIFQHDRDVILYTKSFRRLMHKTQVTYPGAESNEHTRTRLTHTLEVVQISREIARNLGLNEDLAEAIALGHDLGHTPFGHEGEDFLNKACHGEEEEGAKIPSILEKYGLEPMSFEFKHNYQSVRVLQTWEKGSHVSYPTLEGILKHSRIHNKKTNEPYKYPDIIENPHFHIETPYAVLSLEGQIVSLADEIAQVCHDLDDAVIAEYSIRKTLYRTLKQFINEEDNTDIYDALAQNSFMMLDDVRKNCNGSPIIYIDTDRTHEFISWVTGYLISMSIRKIKENMDAYVKEKGKYNQKYFPLDKQLAGEDIILKGDRLFDILKYLQSTYIINNVRINRENGKADFILKSLIEAYINKPKQLPDSVLIRYSEICGLKEIRSELKKQKMDEFDKPNIRYVYEKTWDNDTIQMIRHDPVFLRILWDYVASMTDQYALNEYKMLYLGDPAYRASI